MKITFPKTTLALSLSAALAMPVAMTNAQDDPPRPTADRSDRGARREDRTDREAPREAVADPQAPREAVPREAVPREAAPRDAAPRATDAAPRRPANPAVEEAPAAERPAPSGQSYRAKQVLGSQVSITGNVSIGTVEDIVFGDEGYIEYLVVQNDGKLVTVPWEAAKFDFQQRKATVNITQEQFKQVPTYTMNQYPTFSAPQYRAEIFQRFNTEPRVDRRVERRVDRRP